MNPKVNYYLLLFKLGDIYARAIISLQNAIIS